MSKDDNKVVPLGRDLVDEPLEPLEGWERNDGNLYTDYPGDEVSKKWAEERAAELDAMEWREDLQEWVHPDPWAAIDKYTLFDSFAYGISDREMQRQRELVNRKLSTKPSNVGRKPVINKWLDLHDMALQVLVDAGEVMDVVKLEQRVLALNRAGVAHEVRNSGHHKDALREVCKRALALYEQQLADR